jgi:hypothetical protein
MTPNEFDLHDMNENLCLTPYYLNPAISEITV